MAAVELPSERSHHLAKGGLEEARRAATLLALRRLGEVTAALHLALAVSGVILLNSILLRRRLEPIERLVDTMSTVDLTAPGKRADVHRGAADEVRRLSADFNRMLERLEHERRESGRAVLRAQEQERSRIAQDLHDEVNQALTAILLRLQATVHAAPPGLQEELRESQQLVTQAMEELLHLARQLRPTALDDHGLIAALASQVSDFGQRTGVRARFHHHGQIPLLSDEEQLVIFRVTQESLSNIAKHAGARVVITDSGGLQEETTALGIPCLTVRETTERLMAKFEEERGQHDGAPGARATADAAVPTESTDLAARPPASSTASRASARPTPPAAACIRAKSPCLRG